MPNPGSAVSQPGLALLAPEPPARRALRHTLPVGARAATAARVDESFDSTAVRNGLKMGPQSVFRRPVVLAVVGAVCGAATSEDHYEHALDGRALSKVCVRSVVCSCVCARMLWLLGGTRFPRLAASQALAGWTLTLYPLGGV